jgi:adenine-specific DNA-methyltransferase
MAPTKRPKRVVDYRHEEADRLNNPPVGLAVHDVARPTKRTFSYDPHRTPTLVWAGKAERESFDVEAPSIHVHERLSTAAIMAAVQKDTGQLGFFGDEDLDRNRAIEFYQHPMDWANRLVLGDSLVVMTSLLEKERLAGQVQMIYLDPPYGINYNSNFQARIGARSPKETSDETVTREPEQIQAYRDTWRLRVHSYLTYLRDRMLIARELLADTGSIFVQIGPDRVHLVRTLLDEVFGPENACALITVAKTSQVTSKLLPEVSDFLLWFAKDRGRAKYRQLFEEQSASDQDDTYQYVELSDRSRRKMTAAERSSAQPIVAAGGRIFSLSDATSQGFSAHKSVPFKFEGTEYRPGKDRHWLLRVEGMERLAQSKRLAVVGNTLRYIRYADDFGAVRRTNIWTDTGVAGYTERKKQYVVETNPKIVERCVLMTTEPGELVLDPTCGSGTTAWVAEKWGRRWITVDTSRVALALARERLLTAKYDYFRLKDAAVGVGAGFEYRTLTRVTASSIGYGQPPEIETLYDQPLTDGNKVRIAGPFTVEGLSRYSLNPLDELVNVVGDDDAAMSDHVRQLLDALKTHGIPRRDQKPLPIVSLQRLNSVGWLHAEGSVAVEGKSKTFTVSVGPRFGPITPLQVDEALGEAHGYDLVVFVGFEAHAEAQAMLAKGRRGKYEVALLKANPDLLVGDLLKNTAASQTFRLFSSPDVRLNRRNADETVVELMGVDSYDALTGRVSAASKDQVAAWFLDQNHDGIVFHVTQAFFPKSDAWEQLERALKGIVDAELMARLNSFESLPFKPGEHRRVAVRVITDDGNASEAVLALDG